MRSQLKELLTYTLTVNKGLKKFPAGKLFFFRDHAKNIRLFFDNLTK
jgi:hypothetical protein